MPIMDSFRREMLTVIICQVLGWNLEYMVNEVILISRPLSIYSLMEALG